jgi:hypothetical protein
VGRHFSLTLVLVADDNVIVVHGKPLVGVDSDAEKAGVGVNQEQLVARAQVVDYGGLGQVGHVGHVLKQLVLGRILGLDILGLEHLDFAVDETLDLDLAVFLFASLLTLGVTGLRIGDPAGSSAFKWSIALNGVNFSQSTYLTYRISISFMLSNRR